MEIFATIMKRKHRPIAEKQENKVLKKSSPPMEAEVFPTVSSDLQLVPPLLSSFSSSYRASRHTVLLQGHLLKTWQWVRFHRYSPCFTLTLDSYQADVVVIAEPGFGLTRKSHQTDQQQPPYIFWWGRWSIIIYFIHYGRHRTQECVNDGFDFLHREENL